MKVSYVLIFFFFFQAEDGIRDGRVTGVQTCALPISSRRSSTGCPGPSRASAGSRARLKPRLPRRPRNLSMRCGIRRAPGRRGRATLRTARRGYREEAEFGVVAIAVEIEPAATGRRRLSLERFREARARVGVQAVAAVRDVERVAVDG